jgi:DNA sulfur modification protein DndC
LPWFLGYSGGKDSSALLKLVFGALLRLDRRPKPLTVIYCDTGVEIPVIHNYVAETLSGLSFEAETFGLPLQVRIGTPPLTDRFFVKVIGRGYPPPTNIFRWCTRRLRQNPVKQAAALAGGEENILLLGIRRGESTERNQSISKHDSGERYYFRQSENRNSIIFSPIVDYTDQNVWSALALNSIPRSVDVNRLKSLYMEASGEHRTDDDCKFPSRKSRFGCWTCTVIRKDRTVENLVKAGYAELEPLLNFRNWLIAIRDNPKYRRDRRRNGTPGLGPLTLAARQEILEKLLATQTQSGLSLITNEELNFIQSLWQEDEDPPSDQGSLKMANV